MTRNNIEITDTLNTHPSLEDLLALIRPHVRSCEVRAGEVLLNQDEPVKEIYFIQSGIAHATAFSSDGQETWVSSYHPGDFFGYSSLLADEPIQFQIVAHSNMQLFVMLEQAFLSFLSSEAAITEHLSKDMAKRLGGMTQRLIELATLSVPGRVCSELLRMARPIGIDEGKMIVRPNPIIVDLALRISSTRETVSRAVSELEKKGILGRQPGAILINQPERLRDCII